MGKELFITAEIGINHNGDIQIAKRLIDIAKNAGCDAVKFQKRTIDLVYTKDALAMPRTSPWGTTQRQQKEGLEFGQREFDTIDKYCREVGIEWYASAWDVDSQKFLQQYKFRHNKIASAMATYDPLLTIVAKEGKPTYLSTAACTDVQIDHAVDIFKKADCPFTLMHCVATYPAKDETLNLNCIETLRKRYGCDVGYSGHEVGVATTVMAVVLGATAIERHITLDRAMYGSDQAASLEPHGIELLVRDCRLVRSVLGDGKRCILEDELKVAKKLRWFEV